MSIIAYKDGVVAADRQATVDSRRVTCGKLIIRRLGKRQVAIASTGSDALWQLRIEWLLRRGKPGDYPPCTVDDALHTSIIVFGDGTPHFFTFTGIPSFVEDNFHAWGSGADIATGAMAAGASAVEAVRITCRHNVYCGVGIDYVKLGTKSLTIQREAL